MLTHKNQNLMAMTNVSLEAINPLWGEVEPLPLRETLAEFGHSIPAIDMQAEAAYFYPEATAKLMIENDHEQVNNYLKSTGIVLKNPTLTTLLDTLLQLEKQKPGYILKLWARFNPLVTPENKNRRATRLFKSFSFWVEDVPEKFLQKTLQLRNKALS